MENPNDKNRSSVGETVAEVGGEAADIGVEVAAEGVVGVVVDGALGVAEAAGEIAIDVVGGVFEGI